MSKEEKLEVFSNIYYIAESTNIIQSALNKNCDVTQMPDGSIIVTGITIKVTETKYTWDKVKKKFLR